MRTFADNFFLIEYLVHKLLTIVTKFLVLLKISVLKKLYLVRAQDNKSITFASNNKFKVTLQLSLAASEYRLFVSLEVFCND